jgi:hypothetical protein
MNPLRVLEETGFTPHEVLESYDVLESQIQMKKDIGASRRPTITALRVADCRTLPEGERSTSRPRDDDC